MKRQALRRFLWSKSSHKHLSSSTAVDTSSFSSESLPVWPGAFLTSVGKILFSVRGGSGGEKGSVCCSPACGNSRMQAVHPQTAKPLAAPGQVMTALSVSFGSCSWSWCLDSLAAQTSVSARLMGKVWVGDKNAELLH